jgi:chromosome segregation ATPase
LQQRLTHPEIPDEAVVPTSERIRKLNDRIQALLLLKKEHSLSISEIKAQLDRLQPGFAAASQQVNAKRGELKTIDDEIEEERKRYIRQIAGIWREEPPEDERKSA